VDIVYAPCIISLKIDYANVSLRNSVV